MKDGAYVQNLDGNISTPVISHISAFGWRILEQFVLFK